jgi:hypothetical protein
MAYSRWNKYSVWYTFWSSSCSKEIDFRLPTKKLKYAQCFEICDYEPHYISYGELKEKGLKNIIKEVQEIYKERNYEFSEYTNLRWYLIQFMSDVDEHFEWKNFFLYEWYYPVRNKIIWKLRRLKNETPRERKID